ncbi:hypothetical protein PAXRUDRAFT_292861 [Paxillus rubicundulus Ve08.2h10]|uniref:Uncharacterized protein n=1 Tax=Paxillus rubicundulus Ve08.2h10 TaxID=930991 RepID=A0A0D0E5H9_9AGAM|nr:hypothetical protein PAXRUDRAFT_292861 [Paxillus rubicundulus Ve08.2h10]
MNGTACECVMKGVLFRAVSADPASLETRRWVLCGFNPVRDFQHPHANGSVMYSRPPLLGATGSKQTHSVSKTSARIEAAGPCANVSDITPGLRASEVCQTESWLERSTFLRSGDYITIRSICTHPGIVCAIAEAC